MRITERLSKKSHIVEIIPVNQDDYKFITKKRFWFNWKEEKDQDVYKIQIVGTDDILGLMSLETFSNESRIEIRLLAVSKENRGNIKKYNHIIGNLIAFACIKALSLFGEFACISLIPKTQLIDHYKEEYLMLEAGNSLFLDGIELIQIIKRYDDEQ